MTEVTIKTSSYVADSRLSVKHAISLGRQPPGKVSTVSSSTYKHETRYLFNVHANDSNINEKLNIFVK